MNVSFVLTRRVLFGIWLDAFSLAKYGFVVNHKKRAGKIENFDSHPYFKHFFQESLGK